MSDAWFAILLAIVLLVFAGVGVNLLIWPSKFLRHIQNPWQPDTPLNRVQIRPVGIFFCLFVLFTFGLDENSWRFSQKHLLSSMGFADYPTHILVDSLAILWSPTSESSLFSGRARL